MTTAPVAARLAAANAAAGSLPPTIVNHTYRHTNAQIRVYIVGTDLSASQPTTNAAAFYADAVTNVYAKAMHTHATDGRAYGFPFDDVGGFASYVQDTAPTSMTLSLTPF
jgi:hypothetical protein